METIVERIRRICKEQKIPISKLEKDLGYSNGSFSANKQTKISAEKALAAADYLRESYRYIVAGEHDAQGKSDLELKYDSLDRHGKQVVDAVLDAELERRREEDRNIIDLPTIRHYLSSPAAGVNGQVAGEDYEDIPRPSDCPKDADYCLTVNGDSMEPYIKDGSMVFVKRDAPISDMDVGVFCVDGATYVKQIVWSYDGSVYLLSANPKRESMNLTISRDSTSGLYYLGKVLLGKKLPKPFYGK